MHLRSYILHEVFWFAHVDAYFDAQFELWAISFNFWPSCTFTRSSWGTWVVILPRITSHCHGKFRFPYIPYIVTLWRVAKTHIVVNQPFFWSNAKLVWLSVFADLGGVTSMASSGRHTEGWEAGKPPRFFVPNLPGNLCRWSTHVGWLHQMPWWVMWKDPWLCPFPIFVVQLGCIKSFQIRLHLFTPWLLCYSFYMFQVWAFISISFHHPCLSSPCSEL